MLHCDCWKNISECWVVWSHINLINNHILGYNRISYGSIAKIGCLDSLEANCNPFPYERWAEGLVATTISDNHHDSDHKQPPVEFRGGDDSPRDAQHNHVMDQWRRLELPLKGFYFIPTCKIIFYSLIYYKIAIKGLVLITH